jgi:general L-amino acid transport system permease protein
MTGRRAALQGLGLGITAAVVWWLAQNTAFRLQQQGVSLGFGFLGQPANFEIGDAAIAYTPADSFARAILVGLTNTLLVSVLGWVLSIALGFLLGTLRLSGNPLLRGMARSVVEVMRNTPLLLLLLFLAATMHALPPAREALEPVPGVFISDRGLVLARPYAAPLHLGLALALAVALVVAHRVGRAGWTAVAAITLALVASMVAIPITWQWPRLDGFNFTGGLSVSPELAALLAALVLHHGAHVSEVVRGAIVAVPSKQRDAALALGLSRLQTLRLVVVPQALRAMVPLLATNAVSLTKNSSLAVAIGFPDVVSILNTTANQTGHAVETMLLMIAIYLTLSLAVAAALNSYNAAIMKPGH